jgi:hypothetical protein
VEIRLDENDRVVLINVIPDVVTDMDPQGPVEDPMHTIIVAPHDDGTDEYVVLWQRIPMPFRTIDVDKYYTTRWNLFWKGDWDSCLKQYGNLVGDMESTYEQGTRNKTA